MAVRTSAVYFVVAATVAAGPAVKDLAAYYPARVNSRLQSRRSP